MTTLSDHFDAAGVGADVGGASVDRARLAFRAARRHTLRVRALRLVMPMMAACGLVVFAMQVRTPSPPPQPASPITEAGKRAGGGLTVPQVKLSGAGLKMLRPSYKGFTDDGGEYFVTAETARPVLAHPGQVHLEQVDGTMTQVGGRRTRLKAAKGFFDNDKGRLELFGGIDVVSDDGTTMRLARATVFVKEQKVVSKEPVVAQSLNGTIRADTMLILQKRQEIVFAGAVKVRILKKATSKPSGKQAGSVAK